MVRGNTSKLLPDTANKLFHAEEKTTRQLLSAKRDCICEALDGFPHCQENAAWQRYDSLLQQWVWKVKEEQAKSRHLVDASGSAASASERSANQAAAWDGLTQNWQVLIGVDAMGKAFLGGWQRDNMLRVSKALWSCSLAWPNSRCRLFKERLQHLVPAADLAIRLDGDQFLAAEFWAACAICAEDALWRVMSRQNSDDSQQACSLLLGEEMLGHPALVSRLLDYAVMAWRKASQHLSAAFESAGIDLQTDYDVLASSLENVSKAESLDGKKQRWQLYRMYNHPLTARQVAGPSENPEGPSQSQDVARTAATFQKHMPERSMRLCSLAASLSERARQGTSAQCGLKT